jgi:hypothetical protein
MNAAICRVCKQPLEAHALVMDRGVAHTVVYLDDRRLVCSEVYSDRQYLIGEIAQLTTVVRSLRNRAGRARNRGEHAAAQALNTYGDKLAREREQLTDINQRYYWEE